MQLVFLPSFLMGRLGLMTVSLVFRCRGLLVDSWPTVLDVVNWILFLGHVEVVQVGFIVLNAKNVKVYFLVTLGKLYLTPIIFNVEHILANPFMNVFALCMEY